MAYTIEKKWSAAGTYHTPAQAKAYYGKYSREAVLVHWWNSPDKIKDSDHDNIVAMKLRDNTSIHYVISNKKITQMVATDNVAWHAQSGNPISIGIEFSPHLNDEGYKRGGWLIAQLEKKYGKLRLDPHKKYIATQCPGTISLTRLRQEADKAKTGGGSSVTKEQAHKLGVQAYRTGLHREPESDAAAKGMGFRFEKDGKLTPESAGAALASIRGTEWKAQDAKLKNYSSLVKEIEELKKKLGTPDENAGKLQKLRDALKDILGIS